MNVHPATQQSTDRFDVETGMAVYAADGKAIGTVTNIAGFGATRIRVAGDQEPATYVIQAKTGGGYFNVDRGGAEGASAPLCVPFRGIHDVVPGRGVNLTDTIIDELQHLRDPRPSRAMHVPTTKRGWWSKWL